MKSIDRNKLRLFAKNSYGVVRGRNLETLGFGKTHRHNMCETGELVEVYTGAYRLAGVPESWEGELLCLCWTQAPDGWASHRSAARLWGVSNFNDRAVDVLTQRHARHPRVGSHIKLHETQHLSSRDFTTHRGIPVTTPARTVSDLGAVVSKERMEFAMESMLRLGRCTLEDLEDVLSRTKGSGRRGCREVAAALTRQTGRDRRVDSQSNLRLRTALIDAGLPEPAMEFEVSVSGKTYFADLAYPDARLLIECVSQEFHTGHEALDNDSIRRNHLLTAGWLVLDFTWHQIYGDIHDCVNQIAKTLRTLV